MFELVGKIIGDGAHWAATLDQAVRDANHATTEIGAKSQVMMAGMNVLAQAIGTGIRKLGQELIDLANESLAAWIETEDTLVSLQSVIETSGGDVVALTKDYQEFAAAMQQVTTMGDDAVLAILKTAEAFGLSGNAAKKAAQDAIAIAAINDSNANAMIRITAKMAEGDIKGAMMFSRMIPQLRGVRDELIFVQKYQDLVNGGMLAAQRLSDTTSGELAQLNNDWGDLQEVMGEFLSTFLVPVVQGLKELVHWMQESASGARTFFATFTLGLSELAIRGAEGWRMLFNLMEASRGGMDPIELDLDLNATNLDQFGKEVADSIVSNMMVGAMEQVRRRAEFALGGGLGGAAFGATIGDFGGIKRITENAQLADLAEGVFGTRRIPAGPIGPRGMMMGFTGLGGMGGLPPAPSDGGLAGAMNVLMRNPTIANRMGLSGAFGGMGLAFAPEEERAQQRTSSFRSNLQEEERQFLAMQAGRRGGPEEQTAQGVQQLVNVNQEMLAIQRDARDNGGQLMAANF